MTLTCFNFGPNWVASGLNFKSNDIMGRRGTASMIKTFSNRKLWDKNRCFFGNKIKSRHTTCDTSITFYVGIVEIIIDVISFKDGSAIPANFK